MKDNKKISLKLDESTRDRLTKLSEERRRLSDSKRGEQRRTALSAAGKWASEDDDDIESMIDGCSNHNKVVKKKKPKSKRMSGEEMSMSEPTGQRSREQSAIPEESDRVVKSGEDNGNLGDFLGQMNDSAPIKKRGARTVASMPSGGNRKKEGSERRGRSKSPHGLKKRTQSPGALGRNSTKKKADPPSPGKEKSERGKRSSSQRPMKHRSESPGPMKKRIEPTGLGRKKSMGGRSKSVRNTLDGEERVSGPGDTDGKLGQMLGNMEARSGPKKKTSRSVASAPALARKDSTPRQPLRGQNSSRFRRARSQEYCEPLPEEEPEAPKKRRSKSADDFDVGDLSNEASSPHNLSNRLSRRLKSFKKMAGLGSDKTSTTHQGDSSSIEQEEAPKRSGRTERRESVGTRAKPKRSNSAGPLTNRKAPRTPQKTADDRRVSMSRPKRNNSVQPKVNNKVDEEVRNRPPMRAQSMMLHREMTRRGKSESLADLVNYSEEEIHSTSYFASNHVLVNRERMKRGLRPLTRNIAMDELARTNADRMAESAGVAHIKATYVGNILRGTSIRAIHRATMLKKDGRERANLLNPYFQEFGVGTCKAPDGKLYICQLFSERLELVVTDTT